MQEVRATALSKPGGSVCMVRVLVSTVNPGKPDSPALQKHLDFSFLIGLVFPIRTLEARPRKLWFCFICHAEFPKRFLELRIIARSDGVSKGKTVCQNSGKVSYFSCHYFGPNCVIPLLLGRGEKLRALGTTNGDPRHWRTSRNLEGTSVDLSWAVQFGGTQKPQVQNSLTLLFACV